MKAKTIITIPLILAGLAYLGAKGYIYYKVKAGLDKMIQIAAPFVQIDYSSIGSSLSGSVSVDKVRMTPAGTYDEVSIRKLEVSGDGPKFLFDLAHGFEKNEPPGQMALAIHQLESPISSTFFSSVSSPFNKGGKRTTIETCSLAGIINILGLKELGFPSITVNANMRYVYDEASNELEMKINYDIAGVESSYLSLKMNKISAAGIIGLGSMPILDELALVRQVEPGYMKQIVTLCSGNAGQTPSTFIDTLFNQSDEHYLKTLGFIPGPGIKKVLKQLITNSGQIEIRATPSTEINPSALTAYRPQDLIDLLGVNVRYNDKPVTDLSFSVQLNKPGPKTKPPSSQNKPDTNLAQTSPLAMSTKVKPASRSKLRYIETDVSELPRYLNYRVRIYTLNNNKAKQGLLVSINNQTINIEQVLYSGKMTSHLHISRIAKIEVLRREQ